LLKNQSQISIKPIVPIIFSLDSTTYKLYVNIMKAKELIKILKKNGWELKRINGSHHIFKKDGVENTLSVPVHSNQDIPKGTLNGILKDAGIK